MRNGNAASDGKLKNFLRRHGIPVLLSLLAVFFTLQQLGKPFVLPFRGSIPLESPSAAYFGEDASVIVDEAGSRLLFLDADEKLRRAETLDADSPVDTVAGVTFRDGFFYVWGNKMFKDSGFSRCDRVLRYAADGGSREVVYEADRSADKAERCLILDADTDGKTLWTTEIIHSMHSMYFCGVTVLKTCIGDSARAPETVFLREGLWVCSANWLPDAERLYVSTNFGQLFIFDGGETLDTSFAEKQYVKNLLPLDRDTLVWCESDTRNIYLGGALLLENTSAYNNLSRDKDGFVFDDELNNSLHRVTLTGKETQTLDRVPFSFGFGLLTVLRFLSPVWLAGLGLFLLIRLLIRAGRKKRESTARKGAALAVLFLVSGLISVFYTVQFVRTHEENRDAEITVMSRYFADTVDRDCLKNAVFRKEYLNSPEDYYRWETAWNTLDRMYGDFRDREDPSAKAAYVGFYQKTGDSYLCVFDSWSVNPIGSKLVGISADEERRSTDIQVFRRTTESIVYKTTPVTDENGEITALLLLGMDYRLTTDQIHAKCTKITLTLTLLFISAFLLFNEGKALAEGLRRKKELKAQGHESPEIALIRPLFFLFNLTSSFDGVILVLVAKDMLAASGVPDGAKLTLMAMPALAAGIGSIAGLPLCSVLACRIPVRKLTVGSCALCMAAFAGMGFAVSRSAFALFCVLKLLGSVLNSVLFGVFQTIPLRAANEEERFRFVNNSEMGKIASTVLGPLLGGIAAQAFSNEAIYLLNAVSFVPVIALLLAAMPKRSLYSVRKKNLSAGKNFVKYVFSVPTGAYLLLLLIPAMTIGGYKNYLFPVYLSAMELPQLTITSFYVLALTVAMLLIPPIVNALKSTDYWKRAVLSLLLTGVCLLGFLVNRTFYWAVIVLVVNTVLERILKTSMTMLWPRQAAAYRLELVPASNLMSVFEQGAYAMKETVLSVFLLLGSNYACAAAGGFCVLCASLFSALTSRSALAKDKRGPDGAAGGP